LKEEAKQVYYAALEIKVVAIDQLPFIENICRNRQRRKMPDNLFALLKTNLES
jgi:hypothetical protein